MTSVMLIALGFAIGGVTQVVKWPGLELLNAAGKPSTLPNFNLNWLTTPGTQMLSAQGVGRPGRHA